MHGREGHFHEFADFVSCPSRSCFLLKYMAKNYINHIGTYNDNSKNLTINTTSTDLTSIIRSFMADDEQTGSAEPATPKDILPIPAEGKYTEVRNYIKERCRFDEEFKKFFKERSLRELCDRLTKEFGWFVDEHSLGANLNRHR